MERSGGLTAQRQSGAVLQREEENIHRQIYQNRSTNPELQQTKYSANTL